MSTLFPPEFGAPFDYECIEIATVLACEATKFVLIESVQFDIRRVANHDVEPVGLDDAVEFHEPVEGLVRR